jgi:8-oxo-dGTP diphosphatase
MERTLKKRRRGTAIIEYDKGVLVVSMNKRAYMTLGGEANRGESRMQAAIREIKEETGVEPYFSMALFRYSGLKRKTHQNLHTVYYVKAIGTPRPSREIKRIAYHTPGSQIILSTETREILTRFYAYKEKHKELFAMIEKYAFVK